MWFNLSKSTMEKNSEKKIWIKCTCHDDTGKKMSF